MPLPLPDWVEAKDLSDKLDLSTDNSFFAYTVCKWTGDPDNQYILKKIVPQAKHDVRSRLTRMVGAQFNTLKTLMGIKPVFLSTVIYYMETQTSLHHGILMEFCQFGNVMDFCVAMSIQLQPISPLVASHWLLQVAEGFQYLHETASPPIIHGDFTSANILITSELKAKIGGFSCARRLTNNATPPASEQLGADRRAYGLAAFEAFALAVPLPKGRLADLLDWRLRICCQSSALDPLREATVRIVASTTSSQTAERPSFSRVVDDWRECHRLLGDLQPDLVPGIDSISLNCPVRYPASGSTTTPASASGVSSASGSTTTPASASGVSSASASTTPASASTTTPASASGVSSASASTTPASGSTTPASGSTTPASASTSTPASGSTTTPASASTSTPASGSTTTPASASVANSASASGASLASAYTTNPASTSSTDPAVAPSHISCDLEYSQLLSFSFRLDQTQVPPTALVHLCHTPQVQAIWVPLLLLLGLQSDELQALRQRGFDRRQPLPSLLCEGFQLLHPLTVGQLAATLRDVGCYEGLRQLRRATVQSID